MPRGKVYPSTSAAIGDTPMIRINRLVPPEHATVFAKCEFFQPLNSVKDRIGVAMIEAGERDGKINSADPHHRADQRQHRHCTWPLCARPKATSLTLTMPESMSVERRALLRAMGANLVLTPAAEGMKGAIRRAAELVAQHGNGLDAATIRKPGQSSDPRKDDRTRNLGRQRTQHRRDRGRRRHRWHDHRSGSLSSRG